MNLLVSTLDLRGWSQLLRDNSSAELDFIRLDAVQQETFIRWCREGDEITVQNILSRSMRYFFTGAVTRRPDGGFDVQGDHKGTKDPYVVDLKARTCTCDRAQDQGKYVNLAGPCSHLCAVELFVYRIGSIT